MRCDAEADLVVVAVRSDRERVSGADDAAAEISHQVIPDCLQTVLGNRERRGRAVQVLEAEALQRDLARLGDDAIGHGLRIADRTTRRIHVHTEILRILPQQRRLSLGQPGFVLADVGRIDRKERLVARERINVALLRCPARWCLHQAAVPRRNRAVGIAGAFGAYRREVLAEAGKVRRGALTSPAHRRASKAIDDMLRKVRQTRVSRTEGRLASGRNAETRQRRLLASRFPCVTSGCRC